MLDMYQGLIAPCPECGDEYGECEHRYGSQLCPHGMSAWLCAHPINHYPTREMEMRGEY